MRLLAILLMLPALVLANEPIAQVEVSPQVIQVGEKLELKVTLLTPTWFTGAPAFPSLEITNAIVRLPPDSSYPMSQVVDGETWSGIRRHYEVLPLIPGEFELTGRVISATYSSPENRQPLTVNVTIPAIQFSSVVPAGAEDLSPYIAGEAFTVTREITGDPQSVSTGDVIVINYEARIEGLPALFIPELAPSFGDGYSVYPAEPKLTNGDTGVRIEKVTLIARETGERSIPASRLSWWNFTTKQIETIDIAAINVASPMQTTSGGSGWWLFAIAGLGLVALAFILFRMARGRTREVDAEMEAFQFLKKRLARGDAEESYRALNKWCSLYSGEQSLRVWLKEQNDPELSAEIEKLITCRYSGATSKIDFSLVSQRLGAIRRRGAEAYLNHSLPQLNPV